MSEEKKYNSLEDFAKEWKKNNPNKNSDKKIITKKEKTINKIIINEIIEDDSRKDIIRIPI